MGRPQTPWRQIHVALGAYARGASMLDAGREAGVSAWTVHRFVHEYGVVALRERKPRANALTIDERELIMLGVAAGDTDAVIARGLGRHRGTIGREIRAGGGRSSYRAYRAQDRTDRAARRNRDRWWVTRAWLWDIVWECLVTEAWSPEQVAAVLKRDHPDDPEWWVSPESIYQALYVQARGELKAEVAQALRTGRTRRRPQSKAARTGTRGVSRGWSTSVNDPPKPQTVLFLATGKAI